MKTFKSIFSKLFPTTQPIIGKQYIDRFDLPIFSHSAKVDLATVESINGNKINIVFNSSIRKKVSHKEFQRFIPMP